jgi:hypothetical protein
MGFKGPRLNVDCAGCQDIRTPEEHMVPGQTVSFREHEYQGSNTECADLEEDE